MRFHNKYNIMKKIDINVGIGSCLNLNSKDPIMIGLVVVELSPNML